MGGILQRCSSDKSGITPAPPANNVPERCEQPKPTLGKGLAKVVQMLDISDTNSMNEVISKAVAILRRSPNLTDESVYHALVHEGIECILAARLVEFLPIAYSRLILANSGIRFSDTFCRRLSDGSLQERAFSSEEVWNEATDFARAEAARGISGKDLLKIGARSAELHAVNQLLDKGSKLDNIGLTPPVLTWPEDGPA